MNFLVILLSLSSLHLFASAKPVSANSDTLLNDEKLRLTKADHIIAEHMVSMIKFTEKGYINQEVLSKVIRETEKSKHFSIFLPWLKEIETISNIKATPDFISFCRNYIEKKQTLPMEKVLERLAGNYCRERALEAISRDIEKTQILSEDAGLFIQQNLKFFLTKKNKKNFAYFMQSHSKRPEILKKISQEVTAYSVRYEIVPSQEVLQDMVINEQITKLIQDKGFNPLQHQNVFYAEYGKMIEQGYRLLDAKPGEDKVKDHYQFLKNYIDLNQDHLPVGLCLTRLNDFGKSVFRNGYKELSQEMFKYILKKNNKEVHEEALFFYLWTHLYFGEHKDAMKLAAQLGLIKNVKELTDPRLKYWIAILQEEFGDIKDAVSIHEDVIFNHPLSYYGIMSAKKLQLIMPESPAVSFYTNSSVKPASNPALSITEMDEDHISSLVRLKAWATIDNARMLELEIKRLQNHSMPAFIVKHPSEKQLYLRSDLHLLNAKIILFSQNYLNTFRYLYTVMDKKEVIFNRSLLEILYPRPFLEDLTKVLKGDSLDPIVVLSLIRQESVFNPQARSPVGARGLMQLMPKTAQRFRRSVREKQLSNPQINIDLGTKYFKNLMKRYDGNLVYVLSAYNAGESRVERWKGQYFDSDATIIKNIEAIPFSETRNYVKLIFRNIFFYKLLIEQKEQIADVKDANKIFDVNLGFNK